MASWETQDSKGFYIRTYVFTVDHQVREFVLQDGTDSGPMRYAEEQATCAGPFLPVEKCSNYRALGWGGCP